MIFAVCFDNNPFQNVVSTVAGNRIGAVDAIDRIRRADRRRRALLGNFGRGRVSQIVGRRHVRRSVVQFFRAWRRQHSLPETIGDVR